MTRRQQEIEYLQQQILKLQERIHQLEELPEFDEEEPLSNFSDFPGSKRIAIYLAICNAASKRYSRNFHPGNVTVGDLIRLTPKELLYQKNFGTTCLEMLETWMNAHGLKFIM